MDVAKQSEWLIPRNVEQAYGHLTAYKFAQRYVEGKSVVDVSWSNLGYGSRLLAETARSVEGLTDSVPDLQAAREFHSAPNVHYGTADFSRFPYPEEHFDVVVAFEVIENLERPEEFVKEANRILKRDGTFIMTTPDKRFSNQRNKDTSKHEMYVSELRDLLDRSFKHVEILRCGSVSGGLVYRDSGDSSSVTIESAPFALTAPSFGDALPEVNLVMAVCSHSTPEEQGNENAYLLLDTDRRLLEENEDRLEDVELLRDEIRLMEETEVRAFRDTLEVRHAEIANLKRELKAQQQRSEVETKSLENRIQNLETHIDNIERSNAWRLLKVYRRLRGV